MNTGIIIVSGSIIVVGGITAAYFIKKSIDKKNTKVAKEFLDKRSDTIYAKMLNRLSESFNETDTDNLIQYRTSVTESLIKDIYDYIYSEVVLYTSLSKGAKKKILNKDFLSNHVINIIQDSNLNDIITDKWSSMFEEKVEELSKEEDVAKGIDVDGNEIVFEGDDYAEDFDVKDLPEAEPEEIDMEEMSKVIPPSESDEITYVEELVDDEETFIDKKGRKRSKKTGRFVK
jgi:hypothetical protein